MSVHITPVDLEIALRFRMELSDPPRSREAALSPGDMSPDAMHFAAYVDGEIAGVASLGPQKLPILHHPDAWRLRGAAVVPEFRSRGVGIFLVLHVLRQVETKMNPCAWGYAKPTLIPLFAPLGYRPTGYTHVHPVGGRTLLLGNHHTLALISANTGVAYAEGAPPELGAVP